MEGEEGVGSVSGASWMWAWHWEGEEGVRRALGMNGSGDGVERRQEDARSELELGRAFGGRGGCRERAVSGHGVKRARRASGRHWA